MSARTPSWLLIAAILLAQCSRGRDEAPRERVAEPLPIAGDPSPRRPGGDAGPPGDAGEEPPTEDVEADAGGPAKTGEPRTAENPSRALEIAAEADETGAAGNLRGAASGYGRAIALDSDQPWLRVARAWYLARLGRTPQARDDLERTLDQADTRDQLLIAAAHHGLAELQLARSDVARARGSFRMALRSWAGPPLARALLRITEAGDDQREEILRLAYGDDADPARHLLKSSGSQRGALLAAAALDNGSLASVMAAAKTEAHGLPHGAVYRLVVGPAKAKGDAGAAAGELILGERSLVRWHEAAIRTVEAGEDRTLVVVTIETTGPGPGAPSKTTSTVVEVRGGELAKLLERVTGEEREAPLGCRRGWREVLEISEEGGARAVRAVRQTFVRERIEAAEGVCAAESHRGPTRTVPLPRPGA